jgi:hypothetical protein
MPGHRHDLTCARELRVTAELDLPGLIGDVVRSRTPPHTSNIAICPKVAEITWPGLCAGVSPVRATRKIHPVGDPCGLPNP